MWKKILEYAFGKLLIFLSKYNIEPQGIYGLSVNLISIVWEDAYLGICGILAMNSSRKLTKEVPIILGEEKVADRS